MLFILILLFYNLQQVLPTNDKLDETALSKLILDQCVDKPELLADYLNPRLEFVPTRHTKRVAGKAKAATACARRLSRGGKRRRRANRTPLAVRRFLM
uniref:Uncharacterized protein n=1 Tax=Globodera pallida TaxID=36090 RepID=A0A183BW69_GLOPA